MFCVINHLMLVHQFPDLQWLKQQAEQRFFSGNGPSGAALNHRGWPTVILNVAAGETYRDNIPGPLSLFSNVAGTSRVGVDGYTTSVPDDCFFITNPGQRYTLEIDREAKAETLNVHFGELWLEDSLSALRPHELLLDQAGTSTANIFPFYNKLYRKDETVKQLSARLKSCPNSAPLKRDEILFALVSHLLVTCRGAAQKETLLSAAKASTRQEVLRRLYRATDYIHATYQANLSLHDLASVSALSRFHFLREFKRAFGISPHQYVMDLRISRAKDLLRTTSMEVHAVGRSVGFDTASSFSRQFRNQVGVYPTTWRAATT